MKNKEFHIYFGEYPATAVHTVQEVLTAISNEADIHTTQLFTVSGDLFSKGYRIFVHPLEGDVFELKLGNNEPYTSKEIRIAHNLAKLLYAGGFDTDDTTCVRTNNIKEVD